MNERLKRLACPGCATIVNPGPVDGIYIAALAECAHDGLDKTISDLCDRHRLVFDCFVQALENEPAVP